MKPSFTIISILTLGLLFAAGPLALADDNTNTNSANALDLNSFKIISDRNIFNPNRVRDRNSTSRAPRPARVDSFTLIGTMSYEKGRFAFFDGSSYEYKKTLKPADTIAGYRIAEIGPYGIKLLASSNQVINFSIGMQMRRQENGPWTLLSHAEPVVASDSSTNTNAPGAVPPDIAAKAAGFTGAESEAMKRLMLKRLKEQ